MGTYSDARANAMLDTMTTTWVQLHTGAPGTAGTANIATNATRRQATMGAATGRLKTSTVDLVFPTVPATETYTHVTYWTAVTGGTLDGQDDLSSPAAMTAGETFTIPAGDIDFTIT